MNLIRRIAGLSKEKPVCPPVVTEEPERDQQSADVAIAAQRVNERTDQVRATLAELLNATDANRRRTLKGLQ